MKITVQDQISKMRRVRKDLDASSERREERLTAWNEQADSVTINRLGLAGALSPVLNRLNLPIGSKVQGHSHWFPKR